MLVISPTVGENLIVVSTLTLACLSNEAPKMSGAGLVGIVGEAVTLDEIVPSYVKATIPRVRAREATGAS